MLQDAIAHWEAVRDYVSREILEDILEGEEQHIDWLETQLGLIENARNEKGQTEKHGLSLISVC